LSLVSHAGVREGASSILCGFSILNWLLAKFLLLTWV